MTIKFTMYYLKGVFGIENNYESVTNMLLVLVVPVCDTSHCLFVCRFMHKPLNQFSQNLAESWHMGHGRNYMISRSEETYLQSVTESYAHQPCNP